MDIYMPTMGSCNRNEMNVFDEMELANLSTEWLAS